MKVHVGVDKDIRSGHGPDSLAGGHTAADGHHLKSPAHALHGEEEVVVDTVNG
ncbi:MAG: hypothetical protein WAM11_09405 [Cyanobium sp.]